MKSLFLLAVLFTSSAFAGGDRMTIPKTTPTAYPTQSTATSGSTASATAGSATSNATGGNATNSAAGGLGGSSNANGAPVSVNGDSGSSWSLFLAPLAATPQMAPMVGCAPDVTQQAVGALFGAYSQANSHADPTDCTLMTLRNAKVESCQYASAKAIEDLMIVKKLPDYKPSPVVFTDYPPEACALIKAPPKPEPVINYITPTPIACAPEPAASAPTKKPAKKAAVAQVDACKK